VVPVKKMCARVILSQVTSRKGNRNECFLQNSLVDKTQYFCTRNKMEDDDERSSHQLIKEIRPFISRADEFINIDPKTSYYCRLHSVNVGVEASKKFRRTQELTDVLTEQLECLEQMKTNNDEFKESLDSHSDALHVEKFAYTLFAKADAQDRKYKIRTKKIAKLYYVSANVFDVLRSMMMTSNDDEEGEAMISPEIEEKQRYALWRAGEISKAIRLGAPCEDPPETTGKTTTSRSESKEEEEGGGEEKLQEKEDKEDAASVTHQPSSSSPIQPSPSQVIQSPSVKGPPPGVGARGPPSKARMGAAAVGVTSTKVATNGNSTHRPDYEKITNAQALAKSAVSALGFEDTRTAIEQLRGALEILES